MYTRWWKLALLAFHHLVPFQPVSQTGAIRAKHRWRRHQYEDIPITIDFSSCQLGPRRETYLGIWGHLALSWIKKPWDHLGSLWDYPEELYQTHLGSPRGGYRTLLGSHRGPFREILGPYWDRLGSCWSIEAHVGTIWDHVGTIWKHKHQNH